MFEAWIGLGANQGDAITTLKRARDLLAMLSDQMLVMSSLYESDPWGGIDQEVFVNQVIRIQISHAKMSHFVKSIFNCDWGILDNLHETPAQRGSSFLDDSPQVWAERLLNILLMTEQHLGRQRGDHEVRWGPRLIDLDLLEVIPNMTSNGSYKSATLTLPHPRLHLRNFVLVPWSEIAPNLIISTLGRSIDELRRSCPDLHGVRRIEHQR
jgi:2-amino-4-hydroxy-6-hydroxymethyldihydropteridine diphosphokinase